MGLQKGQQNEVKSNFPYTISISAIWLSLLFKQFSKSRRWKQKSEDDYEEKKTLMISFNYGPKRWRWFSILSRDLSKQYLLW